MIVSNSPCLVNKSAHLKELEAAKNKADYALQEALISRSRAIKTYGALSEQAIHAAQITVEKYEVATEADRAWLAEREQLIWKANNGH